MRRKPAGLVPLGVTFCADAADRVRDALNEFHGDEIAKQLGDAADRRLLVRA